MYLKKLQVVLQVKSPSYSWCFVFVFPFPQIVIDGRTARCSWNCSSSSSIFRYKWQNVPNSGLFMFIGWTHMLRLLQLHHLHIIVCKTSMLKLSIALEFFNCSLFKQYYKPTGNRADLIGLDSVGVNTPW